MSKEKKIDLNWVHPEQKDNEILLINVKEGEDWFKNKPDFIKSLRIGNVAYKTYGNGLSKGYRPLFGILKE